MKLASLSIYMLGVCLLCPLFSTLTQAAPQIKEYHVKARYINGFTQFIRWPTGSFDNPDVVMQLCIIGDNPFGRALHILVRENNKHTQSPPQKVVYVKRGESVHHCHIIYFSQSEENYIHQMLKKIKDKPILTVSSLKNFTVSGGMIQFYIESNKVRFLIDLQRLTDSHLKANANFLRVAQIVNTGKE